MAGRRWSEGTHQAIEAKRRRCYSNESQNCLHDLQNYFRLYEKLSGMTGTGYRSLEFRQIYGLDVVVIPTNQPMIRKGRHNDLVYLSMAEKFGCDY